MYAPGILFLCTYVHTFHIHIHVLSCLSQFSQIKRNAHQYLSIEVVTIAKSNAEQYQQAIIINQDREPKSTTKKTADDIYKYLSWYLYSGVFQKLRTSNRRPLLSLFAICVFTSVVFAPQVGRKDKQNRHAAP